MHTPRHPGDLAVNNQPIRFKEKLFLMPHRILCAPSLQNVFHGCNDGAVRVNKAVLYRKGFFYQYVFVVSNFKTIAFQWGTQLCLLKEVCSEDAGKPAVLL